MSKKMLQAAAGNAGESVYVEDVFSTYLYTGTEPTDQTITNGIDLDGEGGMVWITTRNPGGNNSVFDTERGTGKTIFTQSTSANQTYNPASQDLMSFNSDGFTVGDEWTGPTNRNGINHASWTFRKAEKFFDVVTFDGSNGAGYHAFSHNLGSTPACIIVKRYDGGTENWIVYHSSLASDGSQHLKLNSNAAADTGGGVFGTPTDTTFSCQPYAMNMTSASNTAVAYLFASDAGGFGDDGTENIIKCGSYTGNGSTQEINVGFEPQWLLVKRATGTSRWFLIDSMRGFFKPPAVLEANSSGAEQPNVTDGFSPTATGFKVEEGWGEINASGNDYIYIAIRRPMKTPESGTEVFSPLTSSSSAGTKLTTGFPIDLQIAHDRTGSIGVVAAVDRLRGVKTTSGAAYTTPALSTVANNAESKDDYSRGWDNEGFEIIGSFAYGSTSTAYWNFKRAPGFFDVVAYSGDSVTGRTVTHNLGTAPELMIIKARDVGFGWVIGSNQLNGGVNPWSYEFYTWNAALTSTTRFNNTAPTDTEFTLSNNGLVNSSSYDYVAYMFSSLDGVSKVGTYTGTGASLDVDCGFSAGARFVLVSKADYGFWYIFDTTRGITASSDPSLSLSTTSAEVSVAARDINPYSGGFNLPAGSSQLNTSGTDYIYLAIA